MVLLLQETMQKIMRRVCSLIHQAALAMQNIEIKNCVFTGINWNTNPNKKPTASQNAQPFIVYGRSSIAIENISIHDCDFNNNITGQSEVCSFNSNIDGFSCNVIMYCMITQILQLM